MQPKEGPLWCLAAFPTPSLPGPAQRAGGEGWEEGASLSLEKGALQPPGQRVSGRLRTQRWPTQIPARGLTLCRSRAWTQSQRGGRARHDPSAQERGPAPAALCRALPGPSGRLPAEPRADSQACALSTWPSWPACVGSTLAPAPPTPRPQPHPLPRPCPSQGPALPGPA